MSTITREFTKEQLQHIIETDHAQCGEASALARIALASLGAEKIAEPVAKVETDGVCWYADNGVPRKPAVGTELYTAPPAPVSVPECFMRLLHHTYGMTMGHDWNKGTMAGHHREKLCWALDECRAAILQGAEQPQNQQQNIPENIPVNTPCKEAPEHIWLQTAGVWPENGEFSELTWCSDNQHTDDTLYVRADVVSGNSPVVPDGWVMVPVEPTDDMIVNGFESEPDESFSDEKEWEAYDAMSGCQQAAHRAKLCWAAMIAASPAYNKVNRQG